MHRVSIEIVKKEKKRPNPEPTSIRYEHRQPCPGRNNVLEPGSSPGERQVCQGIGKGVRSTQEKVAVHRRYIIK